MTIKEPWHASYRGGTFDPVPALRSLLRISCQDGSLLLAKYLEHQGIAMRRDFDNQRSRRQTRPTSPASERAEGVAGATNTTGGRTESCSKRSRPVVRVLELGCGTGLAGLAAAFSFGRAESGDSDNESRGAPPRPPRRSDTCEGEHHGSVECVSSSVVEDGAEVVLTDLEYALENARGNINHNASSLEAIGSTVKAVELDWCRPLPDEFAGEKLTLSQPKQDAAFLGHMR